MTDFVLVNRLRKAYWPSWCSKIRLRDVLRADPISEYVEEDDGQRDDLYDHGRIRFFMDQLDAGRMIDPIRVDTDWLIRGTGLVPIPTGASIDDGHHRFMAAVLLRKTHVPARFCGPDELREWLVGERRRWPL